MTKSGANIPIRSAGATHIGLVRNNNEDKFLIKSEENLFIISDGMGGEHAGELASEAVVTILPLLISEQVKESGRNHCEDILRSSITTLSQSIYAQSTQIPDLKGTGATVVVVWIQHDTAYLAHMGDSRIYLFRDNQLKCLTEDHSVVGLLVHQGKITVQDAKTHPARGYLSRYVGMKDSIPPTIHVLKLDRHDKLLLCSDGLSGAISDQVIARTIQTHTTLQDICQSLIDEANKAGGKDNVTVLLIGYG